MATEYLLKTQVKLFNIRKKIVKEVSDKVLAILKEGLLQDPEHFSHKMKIILQYGNVKKFFGFSSSAMTYVGCINKENDIHISPLNVSSEKSKLTPTTVGLQINFYTTMDISLPLSQITIKIQNQLRYKHRTFSCAPEANFHLLSYGDWKKIYPTQECLER